MKKLLVGTACLVLVFAFINVGAQKRTQITKNRTSGHSKAAQPKLPSTFGTYYESPNGLIRLPEQDDPTEPLKNDAKRRQMASAAAIVAGEKSSFIMFLKPGTYAMDELRLLRLSRMTLGFGINSSGDADLELGGDPIRPAIEPVAGRKGMFRVKIGFPLSPDIYLFLEHYTKGKTISLNGRGYFRAL